MMEIFGWTIVVLFVVGFFYCTIYKGFVDCPCDLGTNI